MPKSKVLVIAPHMDDEVLGCGGTIKRHVEAGDNVAVCVVANRAYGHKYDHKLIDREKKACFRAKNALGYRDLFFLDMPDEKLDSSQIDIIMRLEGLAQKIRADVVYLPHRGDSNQDHRAVFEAARVVFRPYAWKNIPSLRVYEVPSSTDILPAAAGWIFLPNFYVDISQTLSYKVKAMSCYRAESRVFPHPRCAEAIRIYASKRGAEIGMKAAESFMVISDSWQQP